MLPNSDNLLCEDTQRALKPVSSLFKLGVVPFSFSRQSNRSFLGLDMLECMTTNIMQFSFGQEGVLTTKSQE